MNPQSAYPLRSPSEKECRHAQKLLALLEEEGSGKAALVGQGGKTLPLAGTIYESLVSVLQKLAQGKAVSIETFSRDLTVQEAARLLYAPVPAVNQMLDRGDLPSHVIDSVQLVPLKALFAYKERESRLRRKVLARLTQESQKMGLYDDDAP